MKKILNIFLMILAVSLVTSCTSGIKENVKSTNNKIEDKATHDKEEYSGKNIIIGLKHKVETDILYTTIILKDKSMLPYEVKEDVILFPKEDSMYKFEVVEFNHESVNEDMKDEFDEEFGEYPFYAYNYKFNFKDIQFLMKDEQGISKRSVEELMPEEGDISNIKFGRQEIMAIGNGFISLKEYEMSTGGGSLVYSNNTNNIYRLEDLNQGKELELNHVFNGDLDKALKEIIESNKLKEETKEEGNIIEKFYFDKENITILNQEGELVLGLPYVQEFNHTGNGSHFKDMLSYTKIPVELKEDYRSHVLPVDYGILNENIKNLQEASYLKETDTIVVLTDDSLKFYIRGNRDWSKPDKSIPINGESYIVYAGEY